MSRVLFPALLTAALLTSGCGGADAPPSAAERTERTEQRQSSRPDPTPRATPSATAPVEASPTPRRERSPRSKPRDGGTKMAPTLLPVARPDGSRRHLLAARALPAYDGGSGDSAWTTTATTPERPRPVGACQKASMVDIGALHAVVRSYTGDEDSGVRARQVVARYADARSAWRAHEVLRTWHDDCEQWLDRPHTAVTPMEDVDTAVGAGAHYRARFGPKKDTDASGLGIVRKGRWLAVVAVSGDQGSVTDAWTRRAVRRIAATF